MNHREIRNNFLDYFRAKSHEVVASSSLIPRDDPSLLFTNAGMVQFKSLFLGEEKRSYTRAATSQKCVRAGGKHNDLENVGHTNRHHTFFEMLGNFSFGDYFKQEAIIWAWDLLTESYKLPKDRLWISVYKDDDEAYEIWEKEIGIPGDRIIGLGDKDNFWAMGDTGPCGPSSEIHIDQGESIGCGRPECNLECDCDRFLEIWNLVFTQFDRDSQGRLSPLPKPNIDTGMGLERISAVVQGVKSNYDTDIFKSIISGMEEISGKTYGHDKKQDLAFRVVADHARAAAFLIGDGIMPSNEGRGYVLRRIIRRAIRYGLNLADKGHFFHRITDNVVELMGQDYSELIRSRSFIEGIVLSEEKRFADTLHYGMKILRDEIVKLKSDNNEIIPGELAFKLYDTYGLSIDIVEDVAKDESLQIDMAGYQKAMSGQRSQSQESWKGSGEEEIPEVYRKITSRGFSTRFSGYHSLEISANVIFIIQDGKEVTVGREGDELDLVLDKTVFYGRGGGQVGDVGVIQSDNFRFRVTDTLKFSEGLIAHHGTMEFGEVSTDDRVEVKVDYYKRKATAANHTATHLLHSALRETLGDHVKQAGSLVSPDRLRFDFSHFTQVDQEKLKDIEQIINRHIREDYEVSTRETSMEDALQSGAMAIFEERYGEKVRMVSVGDGISRELCGGTHTQRTGEIGLFKIISESAVGANLRRIEALTGPGAVEYVQKMDAERKDLAQLLKTSPDQLVERVEKSLKDLKDKEKEIEALKGKLLSRQSGDLQAGAREIGGVKVIAREITADSPRDMREYMDRIKDGLESGIIILGARKDQKVMLICAVTKDLTDKYKAGDIIKILSEKVGGKGGGRPDMAQGGGSQPENLGLALEFVTTLIEKI